MAESNDMNIPSYMAELEKKYGKDNDAINRAIRFRANIILLKWIFDEMVGKIKDKYIGKTRLLSRECLYHILGTNRSDYSRMVNGHILMAREPMIEQVKRNDVMKDILSGNTLLKIGEMDELVKWRSVFIEGDITILEKSMKKTIEQWVNNDGKYSTIIEEKCFTWLINSIGDYLKGLNYYVDARVIEKTKGFRSLTFEEIDSCTIDTLDKLYADTQRITRMVNTIYNYKHKCITKKGQNR